MNKKQIIVITAVVGVTVYLLFQPVKPLAFDKPKSDKGTGTVASSAARQEVNVTVEAVSATAKAAIPQDEATNIATLENQLKAATGDDDKLAVQKKLAGAWDKANQPAPAAFYYQQLAVKANTAEAWITAGDHFNDAFRLTEDTVAQPYFDARAVEDFQNAMKLAPNDLNARTGLGIADVNGGGPPMQGIGLLLGVVQQDPKNWKAIFNLGLFSLRSQQYDKAVERFKTASELRPTDVESELYLAEAYRQLGRKKEALDAYRKCKQLLPDPTFDQKVDSYIKELSN